MQSGNTPVHPVQSAIELSRLIEPPGIRWRVIYRHVTLHSQGFDICIAGCCADVIFSRPGRNAPCSSPSPGLHPLACYSHHQRPIFIPRFCSSHLCNKCGPVRAWSGLEYALGKYQRGVVGFQQKCRVAVCELAPVVRPVIKCTLAYQPAQCVLVCTRTRVFTIVVSRIQGFRSLLAAITVARRAGVIAFIGSCTCARA